MSDLWKLADEASKRFSDQALQYDRYRPRYPAELFNLLMTRAELRTGDSVVEVGAGTGIATIPLVEHGLAVHAVEPAEDLAHLGRSKLRGQGQFVIGRFEDCPLPTRASLVTSFNAWHWLQPDLAIDRVVQLLSPGDHLALVWTEVLSWGEPPFEDRLADIFGTPWPKVMPHILGSMDPISSDARFDQFEEHHFPFDRTLDGPTYVAVTQTYGGHRTPEQYEGLARMITDEFGGAVTKREDAVLYLTRRL